MDKKFPRKELYVYTTEKPIISDNVSALFDKNLILSQYFEGYAKGRWDAENKGWVNSVIPSVVDVELNENNMKLHCAATRYHKLLGMVKLAIENTKTNYRDIIHGLSIETVPVFLDDTVILEQRKNTQHGAEFYDFPTAGQNAQIYLEKAEISYPGLVKNMLDMTGFPKFNILKSFEQINLEQIKDIYYIGFSRGFEVSLDSQFNSYTIIPIESSEVIGDNQRLVYKINNLLDVLDSIGISNLKEDIHGKKPGFNNQTNGFAIVDDCLGTILSTIYHFNKSEYNNALDILEKKGYRINEIKKDNRIHLDDLT